jgi:hypothetical protein
VRPVQYPGLVAVRAMLAAASACLLLAPDAVAPPASAQSPEPSGLTGALLGLHREFPETLHKITPELLRLQEELVGELRTLEAGTREEERTGLRTIEDVIDVTEHYFRELEALLVMTARSRQESITDREILGIRIDVRSQVLAALKRDSEATKDRFAVGEVTNTDLARTKARALKAEMVLEALRNAAGLTDAGKGATGATAVPK